MKNKRRLFSQKDGTTLSEDLKDISEEVKAWFNHLPLEIKKLMPIAEKAVILIQELDDMLVDGKPVDEAIESVLKMTKTEVDDNAYIVFKKYLEMFAERALDWFENLDISDLKFEIAGGIITGVEGATQIQADTAAQLAVYAVKG